MGLLSDPSLAPRNKFGKVLAKYHNKLYWLLYIASIVWFGCLGHPDFNHGTYLSENALSPGLVYPEIKQDASRWAQTLMDELLKEREQHRMTTPHAWIAGKMRQIGLETHVHNYTLRYPFSGGRNFEGKNIYGILRAPRTSSTEGIIFSAPYRPPSSVHPDIVASVPVLLAFAEFARKKNYWAKDLIFLVTEQEQLGMHAFLEAYFNIELDEEKRKTAYLNYGYLPARAGSLQAALNIEVQDLDIDYIDVKIEGLNGQLPNLDMFNLVQRITAREGLISGYKQTPLKKRRSHHSSLEANVKHMLSMLLTQTTGVPNGNHGLFHRHRIEALTLEAVKRTTNNNNNRYNNGLSLLKTMEGISRSLNNLLERFHQSYFFYVLVQNDRFISIGDYMPCLGLLVMALFIKAFVLWLNANGMINAAEEKEEENKEKIDSANAEATEKPKKTEEMHSSSQQQQTSQNIQLVPALLYILYAYLIGYIAQQIGGIEYVTNILAKQGFTTGQSVSLTISLWICLSFVLPFKYKLSEKAMNWLHICSLIGLGTALVVVGLLNFALAYLIALVCIPLTLGIVSDVTKGRLRKSFLMVYAILLNPLVFVYIVVLVLTVFQFPELDIKQNVLRAVTATMDGITFSVMDNLIYNNWLYSIVTSVFLPIWCCFWCLIVNPTETKKSFS